MKKGKAKTAEEKIKKMELLMTSGMDEALIFAAFCFILFPAQWGRYHRNTAGGGA